MENQVLKRTDFWVGFLRETKAVSREPMRPEIYRFFGTQTEETTQVNGKGEYLAPTAFLRAKTCMRGIKLCTSSENCTTADKSAADMVNGNPEKSKQERVPATRCAMSTSGGDASRDVHEWRRRSRDVHESYIFRSEPSLKVTLLRTELGARPGEKKRLRQLLERAWPYPQTRLWKAER